MDVYTVSFFGHRIITDGLTVERHLETLIRKLMLEKEYVEFLVGRDGEFDQIVSSVIRRCKRTVRNDNSSHIWVLPYPTAQLRNNAEAFQAYYDQIEICGTGQHYKYAHQARNRQMADRSDLVVFYVDHEGGAWQTLQYVKKENISYINFLRFIEGGISPPLHCRY